MIRIILVDDHPLVREGIRGMLAGFDDIEVVGQGASGPGRCRASSQTVPRPGADGSPNARR